MHRLWTAHLPAQPIRTYLLLFAFALVVPLFLLGAFALQRMAALEVAEIERRVGQVAQDLAHDIDRELDRAAVILETLATSAALRRNDLQAFHAQAARALRRTKAAIVLIDPSYQQLVDTLKEYGAELPRTADPETARRVIDTKQRQVSNLFRGSISGRPVFNVEVPVLDEAQDVRYVLIMSFQAAHVADLLRHASLGPPWITGVTDNNGIILARSERHDDVVGNPLPAELLEQSRTASGVFRATNVLGEPILRATVRSELAGWLVSATVPVAHVEAPRRRGNLFAALLLGTALVLGSLLAVTFGRLMARPLDQATQAAALLGEGREVPAATSALREANMLIEALSKASLELKARHEHSEFLVRELAHRAKNQLAVVKGIAIQTARRSAAVDDFLPQFSRRLEGLAQSQEVLLRQNWQGAWLADLVRAHLELFGGETQTAIGGPPLFLDAAAVQNLGFAFHELATNASKHGALSDARGRVAVTWAERGAAGGIRIEWAEANGPAAAPPTRHGFGHRVLTELVPRALGGTAVLEFRPEGMRWRLDFPGSFQVSAPARDPVRA
jgi:two-component sensor histidine kinase